MTDVIEVSDLTKRYRDTLAVDDVSLHASRRTPSTACSAATAPARPPSCRSSPRRTSRRAARSASSASSPYENTRVLRRMCFVRESQKYPDDAQPHTRSHGAAVLPELEPGARRPADRRVPAAGEEAHQEALPRPALRRRRHHRPRLARRDHVLRRALSRAGCRRPADLLRPAPRGLHRAPAHGHPLEPSDRRGGEPDREGASSSTAAASSWTKTRMPSATAPRTSSATRLPSRHSSPAERSSTAKASAV